LVISNLTWLEMPSASKEIPTSSRKVIWAELRYGTVLSLVQKIYSEIPDEQRKRKIHTADQPAWKPGGALALTITEKNSCFWLCFCKSSQVKLLISSN
jgi:hypothetical protein